MIAQDAAAKRVLALGLVATEPNGLTALARSKLYGSRVLDCIGSFFHTSSFSSSLITHFSSIVDQENQSKEELEFACQANAVKILAQGIWYPPIYCAYLRKFHQEARFRFLVDKGFSGTGLMPSEFFQPLKNPDFPFGRSPNRFIIKTGKKASEALDSIRETFCLLDCETTCYLSAYQALRTVLGTDKFDRLFSGSSKFPLGMSGLNISFRKLFQLVRIQGMHEIQRGDRCYFSNIAPYSIKHPFGLESGFNVICIREDAETPRFLGFGLSSTGETPAGIETCLLSAFNAEPSTEDLVSPLIFDHILKNSIEFDVAKSRAVVEQFKSITLTKAQFDQLVPRTTLTLNPKLGKLDPTVWRPDQKRIQLLANAPAGLVEMLFEKMTPY